MKKITFLTIALLAAVVTFAALLGKQSESPFTMLNKAEIVKAQKLIPAMKALDRKAMPKRNGVRKAEAELVTPPGTATVETYYTTGGKFYAGTEDGWSDATSDMATVNVAIDGTDMYIQGLAYWFNDAWVKGTIDGATVTFPSGQLLGTDDYGDEFLVGSDDGETVAENIIFSYDSENGVLTAETVYLLESGEANAVSPYCYWVSPVFSLTEPEAPGVVEIPEGLVAEEYAMVYTDYYEKEASASVKVGFDGNDVYFQGLNSYLPEAWLKGTLEDGVITLPGGQYFGAYGSYEMFFMDEDFVFTYDAENGKLTGEGLLYGYTGSSYTDYYMNPVLSKVVEKAAMPANPSISQIYQGQYGDEVIFDVPTVDVNGEGMLTSKLSFMFYIDIEGEISALTFEAGELYPKLAESITEIPYGFKDNDGKGYDFYDGEIFLNMEHSTWNNIGIQSIYRGGDEENVTEIQWFHIKDYATPASGDVTFDFNTMNVKTSSNVTQDGDINEALTLTEGNATLTISPKDESASSPNRFWSTSAGPQLRVYSGTLTFEVPEGSNITKIEFNAAKWNDGNSADSGEFDGTTWTGEAQKVVVTIAGNTQINSIVVTVEGKGGDEPNPDALVYDFEDGTMQGWTTIDADGDGYTWVLGSAPSINTIGESGYSVYSESYNSGAGGALTPDNYLVSPQMKLDGSISFFACAQDGAWPAEHFAVAVSIAGNTDAADFTNVEEWTMTASRVDRPMNAAGKFRGPRKEPGAWYKYTVDLSGFEGAEGYVAIRHFDCTDNFYIVVDNIELVTSEVILPDYTITPAEGKYESLSKFDITFNNFTVEIVEGESAQAELYKDENFDEPFATGSLTLADNVLSISFEEVTEPGEYVLLIPDGTIKNVDEDNILSDLEFKYTIEAAPEVVVLPEGLETETWYFSAKASESNVRNQEVAIAIDGSDIYIQGLNVDYLPEAWVKGTIDAEAGTATFASGQYFGAFEYSGTDYDMFFVGYDSTTEDIADVVFTIDDEAGTLTTDQWIIINAYKNQISAYEYYSNVTITREIPETPELVVLPEGVETEDWTIDGTFTDSWSGNNIVRATEVALDGTDIYVKGIPFYFEEAWMKGTINTETGIATFPTGQFVGEDEYGWEFMVGSDDYETLCDIEFAYDAEAKTLTQLTQYIIENGDTSDEIAAYGVWTDMLIYAGEPIVVDPIVAPEGLETESYLLTANVIENGEEGDLARRTEIEEQSEEVTFDFNSMEVATSSDDSHDGDITEEYKIELDDVISLTISPKEEGKTTENRFWGTKNGPQLRVYSGTLTFAVPEGSTMTQIVFNNAKWNAGNTADSGEFDGATWTGDAQTVVVSIAGNTQINNIVVTIKSGSSEDPEDPETPEKNYSYQMQVGFDGSDVYFKGVSDDTSNMWLKGTLSEDGKTVTIPANQYMGQSTVLWYTFDYYFTAVAEDGETMEDIVLNYDAENGKFTTDQILVLHDGKRAIGEPYQTFFDVEITKMEEFAATPADPSIDDFKITDTEYPKAYFIIPAEDVDGNAILTSKLFYTVWYMEEGSEDEKRFTVVAGEDAYSKAPGDMVEIPYDYDDSWDIYKGGATFYFNPADVVATWTKIGIQSIYYGGGERNASNIVWSDGKLTTGINDVAVKTADSNAVYDLQGRRVAKAVKGLYIMDGKKVVVK